MTNPIHHPSSPRPSPVPADEALDNAILSLLLRSPGPWTIHAIGLHLGIEGGRVLAALDRLKGGGCDLARHPQHGVTLQETGLGVWGDYLRERGGCGRHRLLEVYSRTGSTQDAARRLIQARGSAADGAVIIAGEQTAGRGRFGRRWVGPGGSTVTFSRVRLVGRSTADGTTDRLTFATAVAVAQSIESFLTPVSAAIGNRVRIKWPNDVLIGDRKVAGILVETFGLKGSVGTVVAVIGVGINVSLRPWQLPTHPPGLADRVTSLAMVGCVADRLAVLAEAMGRLDDALERSDPMEMLAEWRRRCPVLGQPVRVRCDDRLIEGRVVDLDPRTGLIIRTAVGSIVHAPAAITTVL